jgi:hypothetical protein
VLSVPAATRTVNAMDLSMDKAGTAVATRPLTPQLASTETQGTSQNPTVCRPGVRNQGERPSEFSSPEPNFHRISPTSALRGVVCVTWAGGVRTVADCEGLSDVCGGPGICLGGSQVPRAVVCAVHPGCFAL